MGKPSLVWAVSRAVTLSREISYCYSLTSYIMSEVLGIQWKVSRDSA